MYGQLDGSGEAKGGYGRSYFLLQAVKGFCETSRRVVQATCIQIILICSKIGSIKSCVIKPLPQPATNRWINSCEYKKVNFLYAA